MKSSSHTANTSRPGFFTRAAFVHINPHRKEPLVNNTFSINNTQAVFAELVELGHPDFANLMLDISQRCEHLARDFEERVHVDA